MAIFDGSVAVEIIDFLKQTIFCTVGNNSFEMEGHSATSMMQIHMTYGTDCQPTLNNILFRLSVFDLRKKIQLIRNSNLQQVLFYCTQIL